MCTVPPSSVIPYMHFDVQFLEKFGVTFRREGETVTLKCTLLVTPELKRVQPRAEWYRDGECHAGTAPQPGTLFRVPRTADLGVLGVRTHGKLECWCGIRAQHGGCRSLRGEQREWELGACCVP